MASRRAFESNPDNLGELDDSRADILIIGGMASESSQIHLAHAYADAAIELINFAMDNGEPSELCYPILYLCRHALELYLKSIVPRAKPQHNLQPLVMQVASVLREQLSESFPDKMHADLLTLANIDPDGQCFRYVRKPGGEAIILPGEYWVSLTELQQLMKVIGSGISKAYGRLGLPHEGQQL